MPIHQENPFYMNQHSVNVVCKEKNNKKRSEVTAVIATLGASSLKSTLKALLNGSIKPKTVLLCVPQDCFNNVLEYAGGPVQIITTKQKGQVAQRLVGFRATKTKYVIQLDDDVILAPHCIEFLLNKIKHQKTPSAVGPVFRWRNNNQACHKMGSHVKSSWYRFIHNGGKPIVPGRLTKAGTNPGLIPSEETGHRSDSEWLPGGCVLHQTNNILLTNFYPFEGKAYSEDVIHSIILRKMGIRLLVDSRAVAWIKKAPGPLGLLDQAREILKQSSARRYVLVMLGKNTNWEALYTASLLLLLPLRKLKWL